MKFLAKKCEQIVKNATDSNGGTARDTAMSKLSSAIRDYLQVDEESKQRRAVNGYELSSESSSKSPEPAREIPDGGAPELILGMNKAIAGYNFNDTGVNERLNTSMMDLLNLTRGQEPSYVIENLATLFAQNPYKMAKIFNMTESTVNQAILENSILETKNKSQPNLDPANSPMAKMLEQMNAAKNPEVSNSRVNLSSKTEAVKVKGKNELRPFMAPVVAEGDYEQADPGGW